MKYGLACSRQLHLTSLKPKHHIRPQHLLWWVFVSYMHARECSPSVLSPGLSPWLTSSPVLISTVKRRVSSWPASGRSNQNSTGCAKETRATANRATTAAKSASSCATPSSEIHLAVTSRPHGKSSHMELLHNVDPCLSILEMVKNRSHRQGPQLKRRVSERGRGVAVSTISYIQALCGQPSHVSPGPLFRRHEEAR